MEHQTGLIKCYPSTEPITVYTDLSSVTRSFLQKELQSSKYICTDIESFLKQADKYCCIEYPDRCKLHIVFSSKEFVDRTLYIRVMKRVHCCMEYLKISKPIEYWLVPTNALKRMPLHSRPITPNNMNGGYTYPSNRRVFIYRLEEAPKVLIHETLHHSKYDSQHWPIKGIMELYKHFNIDLDGCPSECTTSLLPNEAVVEFWAELYHLMFLSYEYKIPFKVLVEKEREFAIYQASKLLKHQRTLKNGVWRESSHAFSYIILRSILLFDYESITSIVAPYNQEILSRLCTMMIHVFNSDSYKLALATKQKKIKQFQDETLRMTCFGDF